VEAHSSPLIVRSSIGFAQFHCSTNPLFYCRFFFSNCLTVWPFSVIRPTESETQVHSASATTTELARVQRPHTPQWAHCFYGVQVQHVHTYEYLLVESQQRPLTSRYFQCAGSDVILSPHRLKCTLRQTNPPPEVSGSIFVTPPFLAMARMIDNVTAQPTLLRFESKTPVRSGALELSETTEYGRQTGPPTDLQHSSQKRDNLVTECSVRGSRIVVFGVVTTKSWGDRVEISDHSASLEELVEVGSLAREIPKTVERLDLLLCIVRPVRHLRSVRICSFSVHVVIDIYITVAIYNPPTAARTLRCE
jgi:hypothetical protein